MLDWWLSLFHPQSCLAPCFLLLHCSDLICFVASVSFGESFTLKMYVSIIIVSSFSVIIGAHVASGVGVFKAIISYVSVWVAAFVEEIPEILMCTGKNYTVSAMCSEILLVL